MSAVFLKILNMSITASWLILAVVLVRLLLKKAPKWIPCLLWGLVAIRLVCPFSFGSIFSLIPSNETIPTNITVQQEPAINSGITIVNDVINPVIAESFTPAPTDSVNPLQIIIPVAAIVWVSGIVIMLAYALISYIKLKKTVSVCVPVGQRILSCDEVNAPFILGVFKPIIYVPSSMSGETLDLVIRHETAHLQRRDHWWKPFGYLLLAFYWFNPLCWIAYVLLCRDIEMACDEKVIRDMNKDEMAAYSQALLDCSFPRRRIAACPLAFGEVGVKERVKGVLNYKKPAFWIVVAAIAACIVIGVCFLTNPSGTALTNWDTDTVNMNKVLSDVHSFSVRYWNTEVACNDADMNRFIATMGKIKVSSKPVSKSRDEGRSTVFTITINEQLKLNFNEGFDEIWVDNGVKPSYTYRITNPSIAEELLLDFSFTAQLDNIIEHPFGHYYTVQEIRYEVKRDDGNSTIPLPEYCLSNNKELLILEDLNSNNWLSAGTFTEVMLSEDTFDQYFDPDGKTLAANMRRNNAKAWQVIVSDLPDSLFYYLLLQKDGEVCLTRGYYDAGEKDDPNSDDTRITYVFLLKDNDNIRSEAESDMDSLRAKYPEYFDLSTFKGLELYVWQMAPDSYSCGLMLGTNRNKTLEELMNLKGASIAEMRAILSTYDIDENDVFIIPWQNPISSYMPEYWIREKDEDPSSVEKRQQEYIDGIRHMLFDAAPNDGYVLPNSTDGGVDGSGSITIDIRTDVCELYLEVLEDLWDVDPGLNDGISQIGIDLSELSHLTELEKETVMHEFASKHNLPFIAGTWEELCEQGYIDKDNLYWEDGLFFSIKTNEDGDSDPEHTAFDAQKWRSGLGAYFFGQCTAQKNADGKWSYTVGQEAIS